MFARDRQAELTAQAEAMVAEGSGHELMLLPGWWWVISAESFLDRSPKYSRYRRTCREGPLSVSLLSRRKRTARAYPAEAFAANAAAPCEVRIVPDCDHWSTGHENEVAVVVAEWLEKHGKLG